MLSYEGQAQVGDCYRDPWGELREVLAITSGNDIPASAGRWRSTAHDCMVLSLQTVEREKRDIERRRYLLRKGLKPRGEPLMNSLRPSVARHECDKGVSQSSRFDNGGGEAQSGQRRPVLEHRTDAST